LLHCLANKAAEPVPVSERWVYNMMRLQSRELNEMQAVAQRWSRLVAGQTLREGLDQLTLLPWRDLITPRIITHKSQCWCPVCLDSWAAKEQTIYWPLLWSLRAVTVCPAHQLLLEDRCWRCQARVPSLTSNALLGFCRKCDAWLGLSERTASSTQLSDPVTEDAMRVAQGASAMLAAASLSMHDVTLDKLVRMLQWCLQAANCRQIHLARALKLEPHTVYRIVARDNLIAIPTLLTILAGLGVGVPDFVTRSFDEIVASDCMAQFVAGLPNKQKRRRPSSLAKGQRATPELLAAIQAALESAVEEATPTTLKALAFGLGLTTPKLLRTHYPQLSQKIVDRRKAAANLEMFGEYLRAVVDGVETPPPLFRIAEQLKTSVVTLYKYFPEEMQVILERRRIVADVTEFQRQVAAFLDVDLPLPLHKVALQLGVKASHIRLHCPDLQRAIVQRHTEYKHARSLERKHRLVVQVREAVVALHAQGKRPSKSKVAAMIGRERWQILKGEEVEAFMEAMRDLGLAE
jgi:hypothetical protein